MSADIGDGVHAELAWERQQREAAEDRARRYLLLITAAISEIRNLRARLDQQETT